VWYDDVVELGKDFTLDALHAETFALTGQSVVLQLSDLQGTLLQQVELGIDDPLMLQKDDVYGGLTLKKISYKFKIPKKYDANQYIVGFDYQTDWVAIEDYADYWKTYGVEVSMELDLVNGLVLQVPSYVTPTDLASDPNVTTVQLNKIFSSGQLLDAQGRSFIRPLRDRKREKLEYPWSIAKLFGQPYDYDSSEVPTVMVDKDALPNVIELAHREGVGHADFRIATFDTGAGDDHDRASKFVGGINVVTPDKHGEFQEGQPGDDNGHGTHVGGILAATLDKDFELGKNTQAKFYAVKMLDEYAMGSLSNIVMGLQWTIDNDIDIINMSLG
jgi:subtilisin family serine protease